MENEYTIASVFWITIFSAAIIAGCILMWLVISGNKKSLALKYLLATTLGLIIWFLSVKVILLSGVYSSMPHIIGTAHPFWYIFGPLLYYSIKKYFNPTFRYSMRDTVHLYPLILYVVLSNSFYFLNGSQKVSAYLAGLEPTPRLNITALFLYSFVITYSFLGLKLISESKDRLQNGFTDIKRFIKNWQYLFTGAVVIYIILALLSFGFEYNGYNLSVIQHTTYFGFALFFYLISIKILRNPLMFNKNNFGPARNLELNEQVNYNNILPVNQFPQKSKYRKSSFEKEKAGQYLDKLRGLMAEEKPFLINDLTLPNLAKMMDLSTHHLSQLLNQELDMSFIEFINFYRVKEAQIYLADPKYNNYTILAVSLEVGFNSKTSFNRMFKKYTGMTPSEFIRSQSHQLQEANQESVGQ